MEREIKISERNKLFDLGDNTFRLECHCKPIHYLKNNEWQDIKTEFREEQDKFISDTNKVAIEFKKNNLYKYLTLRYDNNIQLSYSIVSIKLSGKEGLKSNKFKDTIKPYHKEGSYHIKFNGDISINADITDNGIKTWFQIDQVEDNIEIRQELHLKGIKVLNERKNNQYIKDEYGRFNFGNDKPLFWINPPQGKDSEDQSIYDIRHLLIEEDNHLYYIKRCSSPDLQLAYYPIFIDASTYYSGTNDGRVKRGSGDGENWSTVRGATAGTEVFSTESYSNYAVQTYVNTNYGGGTEIDRSFFYFNTSDLPDNATIVTATLSLYGYSTAESTVCVQEGTQSDTLTTEDYDAFTGNEFGHTTSWTTSGYNNISFNDTGKGKINKTGTTKLCVREYPHDYSNVDPGATNCRCGMYYADQANSAYDPKLVITYSIPVSKTYPISSLIKGNISKQELIDLVLQLSGTWREEKCSIIGSQYATSGGYFTGLKWGDSDTYRAFLQFQHNISKSDVVAEAYIEMIAKEPNTNPMNTEIDRLTSSNISFDVNLYSAGVVGSYKLWITPLFETGEKYKSFNVKSLIDSQVQDASYQVGDYFPIRFRNMSSGYRVIWE